MGEEERDDDGDEISLVDLAAALWRRKWLIVGVTAAAAVLSVVYALLQPNLYTSKGTLLPISGGGNSMAQYAGLAAMAGVSLPGASASDPTTKLQAVMNSRSFSEALVNKLELIPLLIKNPEKISIGTPESNAASMVRGMLTVSVDAKTALISISVKSKEPKLSYTIAEGAIRIIQEELKERLLSVSGKTIAMLTTQVNGQETKVRELQRRVQDYQRKYKLASPQAQSAQNLGMYQGLIQQRVSLEIEISKLENALSADNPRLVQAQAQLAAVKKQIAAFESTGTGVGPGLDQAPRVMMEYANLSSELELATRIYGSLLTSLENARIQEASEKLFVEVIDPPVVPEKKSEPSRAMICVVGTMAGGFLAVLLVFVLDALSKLVADPEVRAKFGARA